MRQLNNILNSHRDFNLWEHTIALMYRGSIAHGTFIPNSNPGSIDDKDILGITMIPSSQFWGLPSKPFEQFEKFEDEWDVLIYGFQKAIKLLMKNNPNILSLLWTPEKHILKSTPIYEKLRANRDIFSSKLIFQTYCGYGHDQLRKMENMAYKGYMGEKRKALVDKYGYDTKNAQHLIRLLRQGKEFLLTGDLNVERPDAEELKRIKLGQWTIHKVKLEAERLFSEIAEAAEKSHLPEEVDKDKVDKLVQEIQYEYYNNKGI